MKPNEPALEFVLNELTENYSKYFEVDAKPTFSLLEHQSKRLSEILKYELCVNGNKQRNIYIKIQRNPDHKRERIEEFCIAEFETLRRLHTAFKKYPRFSVIKPIACFLEYWVTVTEEAQGENLFNILKSHGRIFSERARFEQLREYCHSCGEWLGIFHIVTAQNRTKNLAELGLWDGTIEDFQRWKLLGIDNKIQMEILAYLEQQLATLGSKEVSISGQHGDFIPFNIIVKPGEVFVLDFPYYTEGTTYNDLARFCAVLITMPKNWLYRYDDMEKLKRTFLEGYSKQNVDFSYDIFRLFFIRNMTNWLSWEKSLIANSLLQKLISKRVISFYLDWFQQIVTNHNIVVPN